MVPGSQSWWELAIATTICLATMGNLVLLAENRLSLPTEDRVTALRAGFFGQFLLIAAWTLSFINEPAIVRSNAAQALGILGGLHLAVVAMFTVTEDLVVPRRVLLRMNAVSPWRRLLAIFRPRRWTRRHLCAGADGALPCGGVAASADVGEPSLVPGRVRVHLLLHRPAGRRLPGHRPASAASFQLRAAVLAVLSMALILPDIVYYLLWQPTLFELRYAGRHLLNPIRTLANWRLVEANHGFAIPVLLGLTGLARLPDADRSGQAHDARSRPRSISPSPTAAAVEPGRADSIY